MRMLAGGYQIDILYNELDFEKKLNMLDEVALECTHDEFELLYELIYLLFIKTETNAEIASVFGDMYVFDAKLKPN